MENIYRIRRKRARQARARRGQLSRSRLQVVLTLLLFGVVLGIFSSLAAGFILYRAYAHDLKTPQEAIAETTSGGSRAYDRAGTALLYQYIDRNGGLKDPVPLSQISPFLIAATIATEDASFYGNAGVNLKGLARAGIENLTPFGPGFLEGSGGSSITQQLVKNIYIQHDAQGLAPRSIDRKLKETVIALELKRQYSDDQILEWYLNQVDYANQAFGAEAAAKAYFGKSAKDLTLGEAALLAGLPQAPGVYSDPNLAKARQLEVLDLMLRHLDEIHNLKNPADHNQALLQLTPEQIEAARNEPLNYTNGNNVDIRAPHFVWYVEDQVKKMCAAGLFKAPGDVPCDEVVRQGGLRITTTIDLGLQDIGQRALEENIAKNEARYGGHDGSLVAMRPSTGEILAYLGSRDYNREDIAGKVDIATSLQSHGSTMKMFTYLTAFEQGWVPSTNIQDAPLYVEAGGGTKKQINNWNFSYLGNITVRKALSESVNTAAVRAVDSVGVDNMRATAHKIGITDLNQSDCGLTITLGACEVKLVDMTFAFSVLANNGVMKGRPTSEDLPAGFRELDPVSVLKIQDAQGNLIYQYQQPDQRQVTDPAYAYMLTDILSHEAINWSRLTIDRPAAIKTGTSEDFRDGVVMGYTPDLAAGVWMGNADNTPMAPGTFSSAGTGPMWRQFMQDADKYLQIPPRDFEKPGDVALIPCGGRQEVFKQDQAPSKPGACRGPSGGGGATGVSPTPGPPEPRFPVRGTPTPAPTPPPPTAAPTPATVYYTTRPHDTLNIIAAKFNTTAKAIIQANNLDPNSNPDADLKPGQVLQIPPPPQASAYPAERRAA